MLNQKRSGNLARLKYLVAVPICAAALCASTLGFSKTYALVDLVPQHADTIIKAKPLKVPPPPPAPPAKKPQITDVKLAPPKAEVTKRPPPPPPEPPAKKPKAAVIKLMPPKVVKAPPIPSKPVEEIRIDESPAVSQTPAKKDKPARQAKTGVTIRVKSDTLNHN